MKRAVALATILVIATVGGAAVAPTAVAAQEEDGSFFDGLVSEEGGSLGAWVAEQTSGFSRWYASTFGDDEGNATEYATQFAETYNAENATIETYANERLEADDQHDVFAVYFHDRDGGNVTRYVVANASNGNWSNSRVLTPSEFNATNRTQDQYVSLDWYQSRAAADELDAFVEEYAGPNENLSTGYRAKMLAKYGAPESSMWNTTEEADA
jgi:hypothetical protein